LFAGTTRELLTKASRLLVPKGRDAQRKMRDQLWDRVSILLSGIADAEWSGSAHGDLHLGQILLHDDKMIFLDFDGGPADSLSPLPRAWDFACLAWSAWNLARSVQGDIQVRQAWLDRFLASLAESPSMPAPEFLQLSLLRRWAEEICLRGATPESDAAEFLLGRLAWPRLPSAADPLAP